MKIKKKLAVTLTLLLTLSIISANNYALENNKGNETKKEQKEEIVIKKDKDDKKLEDTSDKIKNTLSVTRISGSDRFDTSVKISKEIKNNGIISIASGEHFADALSAGWLATECKAPLLLVKKNEVPKNVYDRIVLLKANKTALVGGKNIISNDVEKTIEATTKKIYRVAGEDRYLTSQLAGAAVSPILYDGSPAIASDVVAVYNGNNFPDALAATPFLKKFNTLNVEGYRFPIISIKSNGNTAEGIQMVFGGENSVNKYKEKYRFAGQDRYKTAVEIAKAYKDLLKMDIDTIVLASGEDYPDALCAGPLASSKNAAILLTKSKTLSEDTKEYIKANTNIKNIIIVGGERSISSSVEDELKDLR